MNQIRIGDKMYATPSCWAEVPRKYFSRIVMIVYSPYQVRSRQLHQVLKLFIRVDRKLLNQVDQDQLYDLYESFAWCLDTIPEQLPFRTVKFGLKKLFPPAPKMEFSSIAEFALAEQYFEAYKATSDHQYLHQLVSILCREARQKKDMDESGDTRIRVDTQSIDANAKLFERNPTHVYPVLHFYLGCRKYIFDTYDKIFQKPAREGKEKQIPYDLFDLIRDAAKTGLFGNLETTQYSNLHVVLMHLHRDRVIANATGS